MGSLTHTENSINTKPRNHQQQYATTSQAKKKKKKIRVPPTADVFTLGASARQRRGLRALGKADSDIANARARAHARM